jgi:hypothetical protein
MLTLFRGLPRWITNSGEASIFLIFATVDPSLGYKGITCFVADKEMGVEIAKKELKVGLFPALQRRGAQQLTPLRPYFSSASARHRPASSVSTTWSSLLQMSSARSARATRCGPSSAFDMPGSARV